ncbi:hypothetical protein ES703_117555 [subsurface metagenome]
MAAPKRWRVVSSEEYYSELSSLGVLGAKRKRLRSSYFSFLGQLSGIAREQRTLRARIPFVGIITRVIIGDRIRELERQKTLILNQMRPIRTTQLPLLEEQIRTELRYFKTKIKPPPVPPKPRLHRIHIRVYNMERAPTPSGMFQGFFEIDGILDPETGLVDFDWWLTKEEIEIAKYHFVGYWKGMAKWRSTNQVSLAYFDDPEGIPHEAESASYKRAYTKNIPESFIAKAEALTIGELIIGESSKEPEPNMEPSSANMGVFFERVMIISKDGEMKWDELRQKWIYHPTEAEIERVKEELKT